MIRELELEDYYKGFLPLLSQLTEVNLDTKYSEFEKQYNKLISTIFVMLDDNKIIGTGSVLIEPKFIRNLGSVAHIEDIVIDEKYRGLGYGAMIINYIINYIKENSNCYKIILDCSDENAHFYNKFGFIKKGNQMAIYL